MRKRGKEACIPVWWSKSLQNSFPTKFRHRTYTQHYANISQMFNRYCFAVGFRESVKEIMHNNKQLMSQRLFIHSKSMKRNTGILEHLVQPSYQQSFESLSLSYKQIPLSFILLDSLLLHNPSISLHISPTRTPLLMSFYVSHLILYLLLSVSIQSIIFLFIFLNPIPLFFLISWGMVCE